MEYLHFGREGADAVVIIPGISLFSPLRLASQVVAMYQEMAEEHEVYLIDRRKVMPARYTVREMAGDTAEVMKALGLKDVFFYGVSQGGMMGQVIAAEHPELVRALALASTSCRVIEHEEKIFNAWINDAGSGDVIGLLEVFGQYVYSDETLQKNKKGLSYLAKWISDEDLVRLVTSVDGTIGFDVKDELSKIKCPVLIMGGKEDRLMHPGAFEELAEAVGGELFIYEGYRHAVYDEAKDFVHRVNDFFRRARDTE